MYISHSLYWRCCVLKLHVTITIYTGLKKKRSIRLTTGTLVLKHKKLGIGNPYYYHGFPPTRLIDHSVLKWITIYLITLLLHLVYPRVGIYHHSCSSTISTFKFCKYLLLSDDLKIFLPINSINYSTLLQYGLDEFTKCCDRNNFSDNPSKCKVVSFSCQRNKPTSIYKINGFELHTSSTINDFGVLLSSDLTFNAHIDTI